jgi:hypothetical protein
VTIAQCKPAQGGRTDGLRDRQPSKATEATSE